MQQPPSEDAPEEVPAVKPWPTSWQGIGIAVWSSFLAAAATSVLCFAFLDPAAFPGSPGTETGFRRLAGYTLGFFIFWFAAATASTLTLYLVRTAHEQRPPAE